MVCSRWTCMDVRGSCHGGLAMAGSASEDVLLARNKDIGWSDSAVRPGGARAPCSLEDRDALNLVRMHCPLHDWSRRSPVTCLVLRTHTRDLAIARRMRMMRKTTRKSKKRTGFGEKGGAPGPASAACVPCPIASIKDVGSGSCIVDCMHVRKRGGQTTHARDRLHAYGCRARTLPASNLKGAGSGKTRRARVRTVHRCVHPV